jgi:histidine triad (HIT) family protein
MAAGEIPCDKVYEDDMVLAFRDIDPKAPTHVLVIPKQHISDIGQKGSEQYAAALFSAIQEIAAAENLKENGFRVISNIGEHGGQTVPHLHLHLLGGRQFSWPAG